MADQDRFRFNLGDDEPEIPVQDEDLKGRVSKLGHRVSFLTLLLPCLLAVAVYVAYRDLALRATQTQSTELRSAERLSADLDQRLAGLNTRIADLEAAATAKADAAQSGIIGLQEAAKKSQASLEKIDTGKADKKELNDALARVDSALAANSKDLQALAKDLQALAPFREELGSAAVLRKDVAALSSRLQKLEDMLGKDLTGLAGYMDRTKADITQIKTDLSNLQARKLDRESMDLEILKAKKLYQMAIDQEIGRIDKTLNTLQRRVDQVEKAFSDRSSSVPSLPPLAEGIK
jgi:DNA repair exonuclease SbcCD ATPase subunit